MTKVHHQFPFAHDAHSRPSGWRKAISIVALGSLVFLPGCRFLDDAGRVVDDVGRTKNRPVSPTPHTPTKDWKENIPEPVKDPRNVKDALDHYQRERCKRDDVAAC